MSTTRALSEAHGQPGREWRPPSIIYAIWYAFVFSLAFTDLVFLPSIFRDSLQISTLLIVILVAALVVWAVSTKARFPRLDLPSGLLYLFFVVAALSVLQSIWSPLQEYRGDRLWDKGIRQVLALAICVATYAVTIAMVRTRGQVIASLTVYVATLVPATFAAVLDLLNFYAPSAIVSFFDHAIHRNVLVAPARIQDIVVPRLQLLAFEPSMAANYLLSVVPIAFALLVIRRGQLRYLTTWAAGLSGFLMFVGTFSLGGLLAAWIELLCFVGFAWLILPWSRIIRIAAAVGLTLAIASLIPTQTANLPVAVPSPLPESSPTTQSPSSEPNPPPATDSRLVATLTGSTGNEDISSSWRLITLRTAWNTFIHHPLTGVGWGNSSFYVLQEFPDDGRQHPYASSWTAPNGDTAATTAANNMVVRVLAETGVIGGLAFILWHVVVAWRGIKALRGGNLVMIGLLAASAGLVAHYAALSGLDKRYWFFLPAVIVAISVIESRKEKLTEMATTSLGATSQVTLYKGAPARVSPESAQER